MAQDSMVDQDKFDLVLKPQTEAETKAKAAAIRKAKKADKGKDSD